MYRVVLINFTHLFHARAVNSSAKIPRMFVQERHIHIDLQKLQKLKMLTNEFTETENTPSRTDLT